MKKILLCIILLSMLNCVFAIEENSEPLPSCIDFGNNLNLSVQVHPLDNVIYTSIYNPYDVSITNISYNLYMVDNETNKILDTIKIKIPELPPNQLSCDFFQQINFPYKKTLYLMLFDSNFTVKGEIKDSYYNMPITDYFMTDKCIEINNWHRSMNVKYNGKSDVSEEITLRNLCPNNAFKLNLYFSEVKTAYIPVKSIYAQTNNKRINLRFFNYIDSKEISIEIPDSMPVDEDFKIFLSYSLSTPFSVNEKTFLKSYPFSRYFYELSTGNFLPDRIYISYLNGQIEEVTQIGTYNVELLLPGGFTPAKRPNEVYYYNETDSYVYDYGNNSVFYPSPSCHNISRIPSTCIKLMSSMPYTDRNYNKLIWSSPIINGEPNKISFRLLDNSLYRFIYWIFLLSSILLVRVPFILKSNLLEAIFAYISIYLLIRLALPIPPYITLFDITALVFVIIFSFLFFLYPKLKNNSVVVSVKGNKYHKLNCVYIVKVNKIKKRIFKNNKHAEKKGYSPCNKCNPR